MFVIYCVCMGGALCVALFEAFTKLHPFNVWEYARRVCPVFMCVSVRGACVLCSCVCALAGLQADVHPSRALFRHLH